MTCWISRPAAARTSMSWVALAFLTTGCTDGGQTTDPPSGVTETSGATETSPTTGSETPAVCEGEGGWAGSSGGGGDSTSGGPPVGMDDDMPLVADIPEIQQGMLAIGTWVLLEGVLVTTPRADSDAEEGQELFVQDPAGGPWSGLRVQLPAAALVDPTVVGDEVDLVGRVVRRGPYFAVTLSPTDPDLVVMGPGTLPPPALVTVAELSIDSADGRPYEGIPVRVEQVTVTDDDPCDGEFVIEDVARVDDRFTPGQIAAPPTGSMLDAVEGVLVYAEDALEIAPNDPGQVQPGA
ncbi:MAG: hypothetical protein AB1Z98_00070 [Nannocystaceae bacterium]